MKFPCKFLFEKIMCWITTFLRFTGFLKVSILPYNAGQQCVQQLPWQHAPRKSHSLSEEFFRFVGWSSPPATNSNRCAAARTRNFFYRPGSSLRLRKEHFYEI